MPAENIKRNGSPISKMIDTTETDQFSDGGWHPDISKIESAVREILIAIGENPDRDGLLETPSRVARMYMEVFQ